MWCPWCLYVSEFFVLCLFLWRLRSLRSRILCRILSFPCAVLPRWQSFPLIRNFRASLGISVRGWGIFALALEFPVCSGVLPFSSVCLSYAWDVACGGWPSGFSLRPSSLVAFVQAWVGRLQSCLGSSLLLGGALLPLSSLFSLACSSCFVVQAL